MVLNAYCIILLILYVHFHSTRRASRREVVTIFITMNDDEIIQSLWSSDEFSKFDDSDADPDFSLVNID